MKTLLLGTGLVTISGLFWWTLAAEPPAEADTRQAARKQLQEGNFQVAYRRFRELVLSPTTQPAEVANDLRQAVQALQQWGHIEELDEFLEAAVTTHPHNWRLLQAVAESYLHAEHYGSLIGGEFSRGGQRGGGQPVSSYERDRVRALQLFQQGLTHLPAEGRGPEVAQYYRSFAQAVFGGQEGGDAWRLQVLTDLTQLPDYTPGRWFRRGYGGNPRGAPVDAEGNPVFYSLPAAWAEALNDGQRWRWLQAQAVRLDESLRSELELSWARFLHSQFGVQTLSGWGFRRDREGSELEELTGPLAVHALSDEETIARLATGIKRFKLPDEYNPLKLFQGIAARGPTDGFAGTAADHMAQIYEDRRQYVKAAAAWKSALETFGDQGHRQQRYQQVVGNWGRFEHGPVQPAGQGATLSFRFRNARQVSFAAQPVNIERLLADIQAYLQSNPPQLDWQEVNLHDIGYRLISEKGERYLGETVARWDLELEPRSEHRDRVITVTTPLQKAGVYFVTAQLQEGNLSRCVVWVADTALVRKPLDGKMWYYVADAVSGQPIARAHIEFFGWKVEYQQRNPNRPQILTRRFAEFSGVDGQLLLDERRMPRDYQWLAIARTDSGRLAFLGFTHIWFERYYDAAYQATKVYTITDRPVYRPEQTVHYKLWVGEAKYDQPDRSPFAGKKFVLLLHNPQGEKVWEKAVVADEYGGIAGEYDLPKNAPLGVYQLFLKDLGGGSFRVEEYKKPEFEVTVEAPREPVQLGDKITATISARYYFGSPVTKARVKYKVERSRHTAAWYPPAPWDWFYGRGYWWFTPDALWYPGFERWGCLRPSPWWWPRSYEPPELVAEQEVDIGPEGTLAVEIDTLPAKELHGDQDHAYTITAEVVDESRRTIVGQGTVLVARRPFQVFVWVDRGHYQVGQTIEAGMAAYTLDQRPVTGTGKLTLYRVHYDEQQQPIETEVQSWDVNTDAQGQARQHIAASQAGQYRLSYRLTDAQQRTMEGGYLFLVRGPGFDGREFRFNDLELITDKREYRPGETVRLLINVNRPDAAVVLFLRPSNGVYLPPQVLRLRGKSQLAEIVVSPKDMPNFFIEAVTVAHGQYHQELREVVVPPEQRVLDVQVEPSQQEYPPGAPAKVRVRLKGPDGRPVVAATVLSVYDRSVEYIAGGSNVPEIREFFWKWRRSHYPVRDTSLDRATYNLLKPGEQSLQPLGVFGDLEDELLIAGRDKANRRQARRAEMLGGVSGEAQAVESFAAATAPPAPGNELRKAADRVTDAAAEAAPLVQPTVRQQFADTAYWNATLITDPDGFAEVQFTMPENLTGWKVKAWALGLGTKVGEGAADVTTKKNLLLRQQAPRFFVEHDEVVLSANIHSDLPEDKTVQVRLELEGGCLEPLGPSETTITLASHGEQRVDWRVKVVKEGTAVVRMLALTDTESDAMQQRFPVYVHGMLKQEAFSGMLRPQDNLGRLEFHVPAERRVPETRLEVRFSPTLAGALVDALPYLVEYPYGCTEQTLNRFLPSVITLRILQRMQLDLQAIRDKRTNLNPQELGDPAQRAKGWKRFDRNPVFDPEEVAAIVKENVDRLTAMQLSDGGWGWFSGYGEHSYPHTTAVVVHGLQIAQAHDVALVPGMLERGIAWLKNYQSEQVRRLKNASTKTQPWKEHCDALDALVYMILVDADIADDTMRDFLYRDRIQLPVYAKALLALALHKQQDADKLTMLLQNIEQFLVQDEENQTAYLRLPEQDWWWYWYGSEIEANAYYLKLLTRVNPQDPRAARLVKYLLNNRKHATYWNSTRDTALCIEALADYLKASGEDQPDWTLEIWLDGRPVKEVHVDRTNLFTFDNVLTVVGEALSTGRHTLEFRKRGQGPVYYNAYLQNFTLEEFITRAGLEVKVDRKVYKLTPSDKTTVVSGSRGQALQQRIAHYERTEVPNLAELVSGDLIEVELILESKNDYEYLVFEDFKAAGCEPIDLRSGYTGNPLGAYVEFRDERVVFFVRVLPRGRHALTYRLKAEIPGRFSALPARASAMYAPELRGNSDEIKLQIVDRMP